MIVFKDLVGWIFRNFCGYDNFFREIVFFSLDLKGRLYRLCVVKFESKLYFLGFFLRMG